MLAGNDIDDLGTAYCEMRLIADSKVHCIMGLKRELKSVAQCSHAFRSAHFSIP